MNLIISKSVKKKEFGKKISENDFHTILKYAKKIDLGVEIKGSQMPKNSKLIKIYATSVQGDKRIVYLRDLEQKTTFLLFFRHKKDSLAQNITIKNPIFKKVLIERLRLVFFDFENNDYEVFEINKG